MSDAMFDIAIVGGGPVGASLALALSHLPLRIVVLEAFPLQTRIKSDYEARSLGLSFGTRRFFEALNCWAPLAATTQPIQQIHVSNRGNFASSRITAAEQGLPALGYVVQGHQLNTVLSEQCAASDSIEFLCPAKVSHLSQTNDAVQLTLDDKRILNARMVIAADGVNSTMRQQLQLKATRRDYQQTALVTNIGLKRSHQQSAYERFAEEGPLAFLPLTDDKVTAIWCVSPARAADLKNLDDANFLNQIQTAFGYRLGRFEQAGPRITFPLQQVVTDNPVKGRCLLFGNAAHNLHPVAAQGLNLSIADVALLAEEIHSHYRQHQALNVAEIFNRYLAARREPQQRAMGFTNFLATMFCHDFPPIIGIRGAAMQAFDVIPPLKRWMGRFQASRAGRQPKLLCGLSLD
jgi:2-octaprenyl-6-methoxyphenol hydroxylase